MIFFELVVFGLGAYCVYRVGARLWAWADITEKVAEINTVEKQFDTVSKYTEKQAKVKEKKSTIDSFTR
jgi:hypothetical protein